MYLLYDAFKPVIPIFILLAICVFIGLLFVQQYYKYEQSIVRKSFVVFTQYGLIMSTIGVLLVTMLPRNNPEKVVVLEPFSSIMDTWRYAEDYVFFNAIIMNVILFIPFALFLYWFSRSAIFTLILSVLFSVGIEIMQYILPIGRISNIDDVILNVTGSVIGIIIGAFTYHGMRLLMCQDNVKKKV